MSKKGGSGVTCCMSDVLPTLQAPKKVDEMKLAPLEGFPNCSKMEWKIVERSAHPLLPMRTTLRTVAFCVGGVAMVCTFSILHLCSCLVYSLSLSPTNSMECRNVLEKTGFFCISFNSISFPILLLEHFFSSDLMQLLNRHQSATRERSRRWRP